MFRPILLAFILALPIVTTAQTTPAPTRQWQKIANLPPGTELLVREQDRHIATTCTLAWIDNTNLACDRQGPNGNMQRVIYPAASIASVAQQPQQSWRSDDDQPHLAPMFFGMGVGALAGGLLARNAGTDNALIAASLCAGLGGTIAYGASGGFSAPVWQIRIPIGGHRFGR